jgi:8-oxo-dGTP diphosphatase
MIHKVALLVVQDGSLLLCRKRGSETWILPGGKLEPGETQEQCLTREIKEELNSGCEASYFQSIEDVTASGEPIRIDLYRGVLSGDAIPSREIEELWWWRPEMEKARLAPSLKNQIVDLVFSQ